MAMDRKTREERLKQAQRIVARYVLKDRNLVAELIAERRAEAAAEASEATGPRDDLGTFDRPMPHHGDDPPASDDATMRATAPAQTAKPKGGNK